jgi:hypothetical protein
MQIYKEIEEDHRGWKDLPCSWIGRINIVKMGKRQPFQQMLLGKVVIRLQKTETKSMFITLYMCQL